MSTESTKSTLAEASELTVQLSDLVARGADESAEGERLRQALHDSWIKLPKAEQNLVQNLSADLDLIAGTETPLAKTSATRRHRDGRQGQQRLRSNLQVLVNKEVRAGNWGAALHRMRLDPDAWTPSQRAQMRAEAYKRLGLTTAALAFHRFGLSLDASASYHRVGIVQTLILSSDTHELEAEIAKNVSDPDSPPGLLIVCAAGLCRLMGKARGEVKRAYAQQIIDLTWLGLGMRRDLITGNTRIRCDARKMTAIALLVLDRPQEAIVEVSLGIAERPQLPSLYVLRGLLKFQIGEPEIEDFAQSIRYETQEAVPYGIVASDAFNRRDFNRCLSLAKTGLERGPHRELKAILLMYQAICGFELGGSSVSALRLFQASLDLDQANPVIRRNFDLMRARTAGEQRVAADYVDASDSFTTTMQNDRAELMSRIPSEIFSESDLLATAAT